MLVTFTLISLKVAGSVLGGLLLADVLSGLFHWFEDRYGDTRWPLLGHTIRANEKHHAQPRAFLNGTFFSRNKEVFLIDALFLLGFWAFGVLNLVTASAVVFGMFANEIHRAAHCSPKENGRLITALQRTGIIQSTDHHASHHQQGKNTHYCVMTNFSNPVLQRIGIFPALEQLIKAVTGAVPRHDMSVKPQFRKAA